MLRCLVQVADPVSLAGSLAKIPGARELLQLAPGIGEYLPATPGSEFLPTAEGRRLLMFDALAELVVALSRNSPMLLLFEDAHWADTGSLLLLRHLIRSTRSAALCIVITFRENEPERSAFSEEILQDFERHFAATRIVLDGLTAEAVQNLIASWTDSPV